MEDKELTSKIKSKRLKKYALIALALIIVVSTVVGLNIESKDSKLPDGKGNIEVGEEQKTSQDVDAKNETDPTASNGGNKALKPKTPKDVTVTLEIRCDRLSEDMSKLEKEELKDYVPKDGIILKETTYKGTTDNTVFDVLKTLTRNNDIQLEFSYTPLYESYYIEGINYLYEFDGGPQSGWMYSVNGVFPNYGCSSYYLSDGDKIVWAYTVNGYGEDLGAEPMR